ncbi:MAG: nitroreductase [Limosilactobacillus sp.]|uniref:nitroreductase n=1 Tax=Limosilactobacillus sp. TaxID=2773925 RepID=UPI0025C54FF4|nr:nitroreductase [Limosilactobacillus sp.]MCI1974760.1 nitroreductase [Limosilactobacillus sp.]MCI2030957.1 nitroreductase [Limosilactobacillus sp.]
MKLTEAINSRHSVRQFTDQLVDQELIKKVVKLAQRTPSWVNSQPWQVYCAMGESLDKIKAAYHKEDLAGHQGNSDLAVLAREGWSTETQENMKQWRHGIVHHFATFDEAHQQMTEASQTLYNSPVILYITIPQASPDWSILDAGAFGQTLMLAATDLGLGSIPTYNSVRFPNILHQILGVPDDERFIEGISLGYEKKAKINSYRSERRPLGEVLHFSD